MTTAARLALGVHIEPTGPDPEAAVLYVDGLAAGVLRVEDGTARRLLFVPAQGGQPITHPDGPDDSPAALLASACQLVEQTRGRVSFRQADKLATGLDRLRAVLVELDR